MKRFRELKIGDYIIGIDTNFKTVISLDQKDVVILRVIGVNLLPHSDEYSLCAVDRKGCFYSVNISNSEIDNWSGISYGRYYVSDPENYIHYLYEALFEDKRYSFDEMYKNYQDLKKFDEFIKNEKEKLLEDEKI